MLQINTKDNSKMVEVDGFGYKVRRPGAGEVLSLQKAGRETSQLSSNLDNRERLEELTGEMLGICLNLFKGVDKKAQDYVQTIDAEILLDIIYQVFGLSDAEAS